MNRYPTSRWVHIPAELLPSRCSIVRRREKSGIAQRSQDGTEKTSINCQLQKILGNIPPRRMIQLEMARIHTTCIHVIYCQLDRLSLSLIHFSRSSHERFFFRLNCCPLGSSCYDWDAIFALEVWFNKRAGGNLFRYSLRLRRCFQSVASRIDINLRLNGSFRIVFMNTCTYRAGVHCTEVSCHCHRKRRRQR